MSKKASLVKQQEIWYAKLKKSGFEDIEYKDGSIKSCSPPSVRKTHRDFTVQRAIQEYYYMCEHFLYDYKFKNRKQRIIWEYHANGISSRDIAKLLVKARIRGFNSKSVIHETIKQLELTMREFYRNK